MKKTRITLKDRFKKGLIPTEADFVDLIDSMLNQEDDSISKLPNDPLKITALGVDQALLNFYQIENNEPKLSWQFKQKPAGKVGLEISDTLAGRLFIESGSGNIGINNNSPKAKLDILQEARTGSHPATVKGLYITGGFGPDSDGVEFRHSNGSQGLGFGYNTIYATGSLADQHIGLKPRGAGKVLVSGAMQVSGALQVNGPLQVRGAPIQLDGEQRIAFTDADVSNNLKIQLWSGYGLGINGHTLFYTTGGFHSWRDSSHAERMRLSVAADGGLTVSGSGTSSFAGTVCIGVSNSTHGKLRVEGGAISTSGNLHTGRGRLAFSDTASDSNHSIYNNNNNLDAEGAWDGMKMNVYAGLDIRVGNASGVRPTSALKIVNSGNVGIGAATHSARLSVVAANATELSGSVRSATFLTSAGSLANTVGNELSLASIGFVSTNANNVSLGIRAYRHAGGGDWTSSSIGLGMDVDNSVRAGANLWLNANGNVGIGTVTPSAKLEVTGNLKVGAGQILIDGTQKLCFSDVDTSNNLKLQLWSGYGLGINGSTLFYTSANFHSWRDAGHAERMSLSVAANGGLTVSATGVSSFAGSLGIGTNNPQAKLQVVGGAIMPAAGNSESAGILFPRDPGGGSGDSAWLRYYPRTSESTTLELGTSNDGDDHIALMTAGGVGIGTNAPTAKLEVVGTFMEKLDVIGVGGRGDWTAANHPIMQYFKNKLGGKPVGTMMRAIQDHPSWRGHYWDGWVDADGRVRVMHNHSNTPHVI